MQWCKYRCDGEIGTNTTLVMRVRNTPITIYRSSL